MLVDLPNQLSLILRDIVQHAQATKRGSQDKSDTSVAHDVGSESSRPSLQTSVRNLFEAHACDVVGGCLFGVADVPVYVIVALVRRHLCVS
jgi:hypothetical protein